MTSTAVLILIDTAIPLGVAGVLIILNARSGVGVKREIRFWGLAVLYLGVIAVFAILPAVSVDTRHGYEVLGALAFALPLSLPGSIIHQVVAVSLGIASNDDMTSIFALCLICWAFLNPLVLRRIHQLRRKDAITSPPGPA